MKQKKTGLDVTKPVDLCHYRNYFADKKQGWAYCAQPRTSNHCPHIGQSIKP